MVALTLTIIFALIVVTFIALTIKIIPQQKVGVVERFGKFQRVMQRVKFINPDCRSRSCIS